MKSKTTVAVIGLWHLGLVHTAAMCKMGHKILAIDPSADLVSDLSKGTVRLFEPGMTELLKKGHKQKQIEFTTNFARVSEADLVVIAFDTPLNDRDEVDLTSLIEAVKSAAPKIKAQTPVVVASQVPVGTGDQFEQLIQKLNTKWKSQIVCMPENLKLGQAIERFLQPDFLVFGSNNDKAAQKAATFFAKIKTEKRFTSLKTAEMVKHAINMHLAVSITYANQLAQVAEILGTDATEVAQIIRLDPRIGKSAPLFPGLGFSGGTLARDVRFLLNKATEHGLDAPLLKSVITINDSTFTGVVDKLQSHLGALSKKKIAILGITYKPNTSTLRRSPAVRLAEMLKKQNVQCQAFDPMADNEETLALSDLFSRKTSVAEATQDADAVVVVTEWPEFRDVNFAKLAPKMKNALLIDTKNFLDPKALRKAGFKYEGFGRIGG